jgi:hypothetical protein
VKLNEVELMAGIKLLKENQLRKNRDKKKIWKIIEPKCK